MRSERAASNVDDAFDLSDPLANLLCFGSQHAQILSVDAHDDAALRAGQGGVSAALGRLQSIWLALRPAVPIAAADGAAA